VIGGHGLFNLTVLLFSQLSDEDNKVRYLHCGCGG
jgi:hypothetical protein